MSLTESNTRRSRFLIYGSIFILISAGVFVARYKLGKHYSPFYLQISPDYQTSVFSVSPHGSTRELLRHESKPGIYFFPDYTAGPATAIAIAHPPEKKLPESLQVTLGESYIGIGQKVQLFRTANLTIEVDSRLPPEATLFTNTQKHSLFPNIPRRCFNWAGDAYFLTCVITQSIFFLALIHFLAISYRAMSFTSTEQQYQPSIFERVVIGLSLVLAITYIGYHLSQTGLDFLLVVNPIETSVVALIATLALTVPSIWKCLLTAVQTCNLTTQQITILTLFALLISRYLLSGAFPSLQSGDYGTYERLGNLIIDEKWDEVNNGFYLDRLYAERALLFGAPVAYMSKFIAFAPHLINFGLIATISILLFRIVSKQYGQLAASITAIAFNIHPDILFGGHLCRHDNPSLLYLTIILLLLSTLKERLWHSTHVSLKLAAGLIPTIVFIGLLFGLIEIQRSYMPFLLITSMIVLLNPFEAASSFFSSRDRIPSAVLRVISACIVTICISAVGIFLVTSIRGYLTKKAGQFTTRSLLDNLCALETTKAGDWQSIHGWLANYPIAIPLKNKVEFARRKLLYEKFTQYKHLPSHLSQKAGSIVGIRSAIRMSGAQQQYEQFPYVFFVPYSSAKYAFGFCSTLVLLLLALFRCFNISQLPAKSFEAVFFTFSLVFILVVLFLSESAEQYDLFLAIPLAINAGIVLSPLLQTINGNCKKTSIQRTFLEFDFIRYLVPGIVALSVTITTYYCIANYISKQPKLTFVPTDGEVTFTGPALCDNETDRLSLTFPDEKTLKDTVVSATVKLQRKHFSGPQIRFFLSQDQRHRNQIWNHAGHEQPNASYQVKINNRIVFNGNMSSLLSPKYLSTDLPEEEHFDLTIQMHALADINEAPDSKTSLTLEYLH
jgi:hypothetical protein